MKQVLASVLCLLPYFASASEVEGKAIICLEEVDPSSELNPEMYPTERVYRGFKFVEDHKVEGYILRHDDNVSQIHQFGHDRGRRYEYAGVIDFWSDWSLDRKTLVLSVNFSSGNKDEYSCEVFSNFDDYEAAFENYRKQEQKAINQMMEGNRI